MEPDFVAQNGEIKSREDFDRWMEKNKAEFNPLGCTHVRITKHETIPNLVLFEGWKVRPNDEGEPRFALTLAR